MWSVALDSSDDLLSYPITLASHMTVLLISIFFKQPILSLCFEEAIASLSFLPGQPHMLAVGTSMGWVRVFDTREDPKKAAQISLMAHPASRPRKVKGIRPDPFNEQVSLEEL